MSYTGVPDSLHAELWNIIKTFGKSLRPDLDLDYTVENRSDQEEIIYQLGFSIDIDIENNEAILSLTTIDNFKFSMTIKV